VYCGDTYQSIYEWRGAIDALSLVNVDEALWLTQSFRFGDEIAQVANNFLNLLDSPAKVRGLPSMVSTVGEVVDPAAILCRTNYGVIVSLTEAQSAGQRAALLGNVREDLQAFARGCARLMEGQRTGHPELAPFKDWQAALKWATDEEESASDIAMRIRLVNSIGALKLLRTLDDVVEEDEADVIVSTAHRAKGREWDSVRLAGDYKHPADMSEDELKLTYVSVTRARRELDISNLPTANGEPPRLFQNQLGGSQVASRPKRQRPPINSTVMAQKPVERHGVVGRLLKTNTDDR
jgi:superfamily I DNA/RNA helicase